MMMIQNSNAATDRFKIQMVEFKIGDPQNAQNVFGATVPRAQNVSAKQNVLTATALVCGAPPSLPGRQKRFGGPERFIELLLSVLLFAVPVICTFFPLIRFGSKSRCRQTRNVRALKTFFKNGQNASKRFVSRAPEQHHVLAQSRCPPHAKKCSAV